MNNNPTNTFEALARLQAAAQYIARGSAASRLPKRDPALPTFREVVEHAQPKS